MSEKLEIARIIDAHRITGMQIGIFIICAAVALFDGYDTQAIGYVAPLLAVATKTPITSFGTVFSIGLAGAAIGAFVFGPLADCFGRRWLLVVACVLFSTFSLLTITAASFTALVTLRFITGLGLGGAVPISLALVSEYFPVKFRGLAMTGMFSAFPLGGFIGGLIASSIIERYGWQSIFLIGGILPGVVCLALIIWVPESIRFLASQGRQDEVRHILARIAPGAVGPADSIVHQQRASGNVASKLFAQGRFAITLLLWIPFFMGFMVIVTVVLWGPSLLSESGVPISVGALVFAFHYFGGFVGSAGSGYLVDKYGPIKTLVPGFLVGAAALTIFGHLTWSPVLLCADAFLLGLLLAGSSNGLLPLAASFYPTQVRSTGIGWAMGTGRFGQLIGPLLVGLMLSSRQTSSIIFTAAAIPCIISAAFVWIVSTTARRMKLSDGRESEPAMHQQTHSALTA
jgi:MFS transporter, AAHS family, 4-hydroxybenzoate transporter